MIGLEYKIETDLRIKPDKITAIKEACGVHFVKMNLLVQNLVRKRSSRNIFCQEVMSESDTKVLKFEAPI